jgi:hypothetical protein
MKTFVFIVLFINSLKAKSFQFWVSAAEISSRLRFILVLRHVPQLLVGPATRATTASRPYDTCHHCW